ncbi:MAG: SufE family protein [Candidatus Marinimicrobia bacterium]|nr:SufE family protein [Candidatus Neomarinimicrobiota bacterium]
MNIQDVLAEIREDFDLFDDPRDKFAQLMDIGKQAPEFNPADRREENRVIGCSSQAWLVWQKHDDGTFSFQADSDAHIVKGLLTILTRIFEGESAAQIQSISGNEIFSAIGLEGTITSQRTNGFMSALRKIQMEITKV